MTKTEKLTCLERLNIFVEKNNLLVIDKISQGFSSEIHLVETSEGKKFSLKIERDKSRRIDMTEKEVSNLKLANEYGIGPKLVSFDFENRVVLYNFIEGTTFLKWIFSNPKRNILKNFLNELFRQARLLDQIKLDHGQLAGRGTNILVSNGLPIIIDFEKASQNRNCHNVSTLTSLIALNKRNSIRMKVRKILRGEKD